MTLNFDALRARHTADAQTIDGIEVGGRSAAGAWRAAHADRGALLAEVDQHEARVARFAEDATRWAQGATALRREYEQIKTTVAGLRDHALAETLRADAAQAALDRLAAVTVEEVAQAMDTQTRTRVGGGTATSAMAAAALALVRARVEGRDA